MPNLLKSVWYALFTLYLTCVLTDAISAQALEAERQLANNSYRDCFRNTANRNAFRTWTGIMLQGFQQLTGINFIIYYGTTFFISAGITNAFIVS